MENAAEVWQGRNGGNSGILGGLPTLGLARGSRSKTHSGQNGESFP